MADIQPTLRHDATLEHIYLLFVALDTLYFSRSINYVLSGRWNVLFMRICEEYLPYHRKTATWVHRRSAQGCHCVLAYAHV